MLDLKELCFLTNILKETKDRDHAPHKQSSRLYGDAMMGLYQMGVLPENNEWFSIDGEQYRIPENLKRFIHSDGKTSKPVEEEKASAEKAPAKPVSAEPEIVMPEPERKPEKESGKKAEKNPENVADHNPTAPSKTNVEPAKKTLKEKPEKMTSDQATEPVRELHEPQAIVDRHRIKLTNVRNPSDVSDLTVTVLPLSVKTSDPSADIAVEVERNGKTVYFVSETKGRKSILADIDGITFSVRGQWLDGQFRSMIYLTGTMKSSHKMTDKNKEIRPETVSPELFHSDFIRKVGDSTLYILPFDRINEPGGQVKCAVIQETSDDRQISADTETHVLLMYIDGLNFRVYAKWDVDKQYEISIDQID